MARVFSSRQRDVWVYLMSTFDSVFQLGMVLLMLVRMTITKTTGLVFDGVGDDDDDGFNKGGEGHDNNRRMVMKLFRLVPFTRSLIKL